MVKLKVGDRFPDINAAGLDGDVDGDSLKGKHRVIYFYPKDNTPGCTKEAKDFRDLNGEFEALGASIIGISTDSVKSHKKFAEKYDLNFELVSDSDGILCSSCGVTGMMGKTAKRTTFLVDKDGIIRHIWESVSVRGHAEDVLGKVKEIEGG
jgi:peroxiredoxin Q/BCP